MSGIDASLKEATKPNVTDQPCTDGKDHRDSDLCAQWKAADAAASAALAAWLIGGVGSLIGLITMAAAIWAAFYAKRAAKAGEDSVNETRRIGEAQTRCYLSVIEARVALHGNVPLLQVKVRNSGQSPARALCASYGFSPSIGGGFTFDSMAMVQHEAIEDIATQDSVWLPVWHPDKLLTAREVADWSNDATSANSLALKVILEGKDVFDEPVECCEHFLARCTRIGDGEFHALSTFNQAKADAKAKLLAMEFEDIVRMQKKGK